MFDLDKWQEIFDTMRRNKLRTFLTAFGVFWGIFILIVLLGAGKAMENGIKREFGDRVSNSYWLWAWKTTIPSHGLKPGRQIIFTNQDVKDLQQYVEGVDFAGTRNNLFGEYVVKYKDKNGSFRMFGATGDFLAINGEKLNKGRLLNRSDEQGRRKVVLLGEKAKKILFGDDDAIGKWIDIKGIYFQVVGIYNTNENNGQAEERGYIPFSTLQNAFGQQNRVERIALVGKKGEKPEEMIHKIKTFMAKKHKFDIEDEQAMGVRSNEEQMKQFLGLFGAIALFVWIIGIMTLIAGIVGVSNIMLIIVQERTREIGVRKALGATPFSIVSLIIQESVVITSLAGYVGLLLGASLLALFSNLIDMVEAEGGRVVFFYRPEVELSTGLSALITLVIAGAIAGLMPALRAARIKPIEALRAD
jgi:putative ABC transport system permease protein